MQSTRLKFVVAALLLLASGCTGVQGRLVGKWEGGVDAGSLRSDAVKQHALSGLLAEHMTLELKENWRFVMTGGTHSVRGWWAAEDLNLWLTPHAPKVQLTLLVGEDEETLSEAVGLRLKRVDAFSAPAAPAPTPAPPPQADPPPGGELESSVVLVDSRNPAYTVYGRYLARQREQVETAIAKEAEHVLLLPWSTFLAERELHVRHKIVKDDYPGQRAAEGVVELIKRHPAGPIGLTWNGGIAITRNDYTHAKRTYARYHSNPDAYEETRNRDPRADPVYPKWHLGPLLGW